MIKICKKFIFSFFILLLSLSSCNNSKFIATNKENETKDDEIEKAKEDETFNITLLKGYKESYEKLYKVLFEKRYQNKKPLFGYYDDLRELITTFRGKESQREAIEKTFKFITDFIYINSREFFFKLEQTLEFKKINPDDTESQIRFLENEYSHLPNPIPSWEAYKEDDYIYSDRNIENTLKSIFSSTSFSTSKLNNLLIERNKRIDDIDKIVKMVEMMKN